MVGTMFHGLRKATKKWPKGCGWICAVAIVLLATLLRFPLRNTLRDTVPFILYYPAVMFAAWYGGFSVGVVTTVLSAFAADFFFVEPRYQISSISSPLWLPLLIFVLSGLFTSFLCELRFRSLVRDRELKKLLEKEKRFVEQILTSIDDLFAVIGFDWRIIYANEHFARAAHSTKKQLEGQPVWKIFPHMEALDRPHVEKAMTQRVPVRFETYNKTAGAWFTVGVFPCEEGVTIYAIDISDRKKMEQALHESRANLEREVQKRTAQLQETVAQLESFSYTVSHDLRSPLRAMQAFAHMTLEEEGASLTDTSREYLQRIDAAAQRMDRLIQDVITYNKVARMEMRLEPVNPEQLVEEIIQQYPSVNKPHASFEIQHPMEKVLANPSAFVQALANVLTNAVKFVDPGQKAKIKVWTEKSDEKVCLCVEDEGIGISPESISKIFEPFHRAHVNSGYEGTGIGLAVARKAVERMGGKMDVESTVGRGSKFCIELQAA